ncbi:MAG: Spy/CpxP family protein refolding chaperone [Candidatus Omnitrophota bacterium]
MNKKLYLMAIGFSIFAALCISATAYSQGPIAESDNALLGKEGIDGPSEEGGPSFVGKGCSSCGEHKKSGFGGKGGGVRERKGEGGRDAIIKKLGLTTEQSAAIESHKTDHRAKMQEAKEALKTKKRELHNELEKPDMDEAKVNTLAAEVKALSGQQIDLSVRGILAMKAILTPEQFAKLQSEVKKCSKRGGGKTHRGGAGRKKMGRNIEPGSKVTQEEPQDKLEE